MSDTHFSELISKKRISYGVQFVQPLDGEFYFDNLYDTWFIYDATSGKWFGKAITSSTSTSTSSTSTSTSTTTTSTSTSTTTTTSTSTSTSTTTTL